MSNLFESPKFIVVEGPIRAGKSTLAKTLAETLHARRIVEPEDNPFLERFYQGAPGTAFAAQMWFLEARHEQMRREKEARLAESPAARRPVVADYLFEKDKLFAYINLSDAELDLYNRYFQTFRGDAPAPDLVIYLQANAEALKQRLKRKRAVQERAISDAYIEQVIQSYEHFFFHYTGSDLLVVDTSRMDFVHRNQDLRTLLKRLSEPVRGRNISCPLKVKARLPEMKRMAILPFPEHPRKTTKDRRFRVSIAPGRGEIMRLLLSVPSLLILLPALALQASAASRGPIPPPKQDMPLAASSGKRTAVFAGGCFWGTQAVFERLKGVLKTTVGYSGGSAETATYPQVTTETTGHAESVEVVYDPSRLTYGELLRIFFSVAHDPTELNRQGPDIGPSYRSVIFYANPDQKRIAEAYIAQLDAEKAFKRPIVTQVVPLKAFYPAEDYHQDYALRNPGNPYIQICDRPKIAQLKKQFPDLFVEYKGGR